MTITVSSRRSRIHCRTGSNFSKTTPAGPLASPSIATPRAGMCDTPIPATTSAMGVPPAVAHHLDELLGAHTGHGGHDVGHLQPVDHADLVDEVDVAAELDHPEEVALTDGDLLILGQPEALHERLGIRDERLAVGLLVECDREVVQRQAHPGASAVEHHRSGDLRRLLRVLDHRAASSLPAPTRGQRSGLVE